MTKSVAYIDGANLQNAVQRFDWKFDYARFRVWLKDKFDIEEAYLFIGKIEKYNKLYKYLEEIGYILIFKEVTYKSGKPKGNVDAELVLTGVREYFEDEIEKVVLVSSDGDYKCLVEFWKEKEINISIISPYPEKYCSKLLRKTKQDIYYIYHKKNILCEQKKDPDEHQRS